MENKRKEFNIFINNIQLAHKQFYIWKTLKKEKTAIILFRENGFLWNTILVTLMREYLSGLAKIFEQRESKFGKVLSIYYFMEYEFDKNKETIEKLRKFRHKLLMHSDVKKHLDLANFLKETDLTPGEIEDLLIKLIEVTSKIKDNFGIKIDLIKDFDNTRKLYKKEVLELIDKYNKSK